MVINSHEREHLQAANTFECPIGTNVVHLVCSWRVTKLPMGQEVVKMIFSNIIHGPLGMLRHVVLTHFEPVVTCPPPPPRKDLKKGFKILGPR